MVQNESANLCDCWVEGLESTFLSDDLILKYACDFQSFCSFCTKTFSSRASAHQSRHPLRVGPKMTQRSDTGILDLDNGPDAGTMDRSGPHVPW